MFVVREPLQVRGERLGKPTRLLLVLRTGRIYAGELGMPRLRQAGPVQLARGSDHLARPLRIGFPQESQVEQPFAGVIDDIEVEASAAQTRFSIHADSYSMVSLSSLMRRVEFGQMRRSTRSAT